MSRTISSAFTFSYKFLLPVFLAWVAFFLLELLRGTPAAIMHGGATGTASPNFIWLAIAALLCGLGVLLWTTLPLKKVSLAPDGSLIVSNYVREWTVPASLIVDVRQNRWIRMRPITIRLRWDPGCGTRIVFAPPQRWKNRFLFWREDPEVQELRDLAAESSGGWRSRLRAESGVDMRPPWAREP